MKKEVSVVVESKAAESECAQCGSRLSSSGVENFCVTCLLRGALPEKDVDLSDGPRRFDQYELVIGEDGVPVELGRGAMGVTYKAFDTNLRCEVALKLINPRYLADESSRARFLSEARAAAQLRHRNIASVFHLGTENGDYFYAMELVDGETIEDRVRRDGPIDCATALDIALQITRALIAAGNRQLVHRDIKSSNVMLCTEADGAIVAKVIDFGLVKPITTALVASRGGFVGTPHFASPEQFAAQTTDARSDMYSLGITLWFMLTGKLPFHGTREEIQEQQLTAKLPLEELAHAPRIVVDLIKRLLEIDPTWRPQTPVALKDELNACIANIDVAKQKQRRRKTFAYGSLAAAAAAVVAALALSYFLRPTTLSEKSIAVLPFRDLSPAKDQEYFSDGITEEIRDALSNVAGLRVAARTSSFAFKGKNTDAGEIAHKLNVENILEGSLRREGNRIRLSVRLINARIPSELWSETFDREVQGVFALQDEVTRAIVDAMKIKLAVTPSARVPRNTEAYDLYLRGLYYSNKGNEQEMRKALDLFQEALNQDPNFAPAWTGIAKVWDGLADAYVKPLEAYPLCQAAALKAIALDANEAEAHVYLGEAKSALTRDQKAAVEEYRRAIEIDPNLGRAHLFLGVGILCQGDLAQGLAEMQEAVKLDPLSASSSEVLGWGYIINHRLDEAIAEGKRTNAIDPNYAYMDSALGDAYREKGDFESAIEAYSRAETATHLPSAGLAITLARLGRKVEAESKLAELLQRSERSYVDGAVIAMVYVALNRMDEALQYLERAYQQHSENLVWIAVDLEFEPLRSDPRFRDLVRRIGLDPAKALPH